MEDCVLTLTFNVPSVQMLKEHRTIVPTKNSFQYDLAVDTNHNGDGGFHIHVKRHGEKTDLFSMKQDGSMHDEQLIINSGFRFSKTFIKTISELPQLKKYCFNWTGIPSKYCL